MAGLIILFVILLIIPVINLRAGPIINGSVLHLQGSYPTGILEPTKHRWVRICWMHMPRLISREGSNAESPYLYTGLVAHDRGL